MKPKRVNWRQKCKENADAAKAELDETIANSSKAIDLWRAAWSEEKDNVQSFQRQRDDFQKEAKQFRDLAEERRRKLIEDGDTIKRLTENERDLSQQLLKRGAECELLKLLIRECLNANNKR